MNLSHENIMELIGSGENLNIEFKAQLSAKNEREVCKEIAAFATTGWGLLFIGVTDKGKIVGIADAQGIRDKITKWTHNYVFPIPQIDVQIADFGKSQILIVHSKNDGAPYYSYDSKPYHRVGTDSQVMNQDQVTHKVRNSTLENSLVKINSDLAETKLLVWNAKYVPAVSIIGQGDLATKNYSQIKDNVVNDVAASAHFASLSVRLFNAESIRFQPALSIVNQGDLATMNYVELKSRIFSECQHTSLTYYINLVDLNLKSELSNLRSEVSSLRQSLLIETSKRRHLEQELVLEKTNTTSLEARLTAIEKKLRLLAS